MPALNTRSVPMAELRTGDRIEARHSHQQRYIGIVELVSRELGVVWVRETRLGGRKLLDATEYQLYRCPA